MKLLKPCGRLSLCARYVREGSRLADIGTDHAYLPIALCMDDKIPSALACDINPLPLRAAREHIARYHLDDRITARLSDGLHGVSADEVDDIVIAGMGGELIAAILDAAPWVQNSAKHLVLQPMTHHEDVIAWLYDHGFAVLRQEAVLDEKKYYTVISAQYDGQIREHDLYDRIIGRLDTADTNSRGFLHRCLNNLKNRSKGDPSLCDTVNKLEVTLNEDQ